MTDRLNYTAHAIEDIQRQQDEFAKYPEMAEPLVDWTLDHLDQAVKFILPDRGELLDLTGFDQRHAELIKLPYPVTVIEAPFPPRPEQRLADTKEVSSRRIGLYIEMSAAEVLSQFPGAEKPPEGTTGVLVIAVYYIDDMKHWEVSGCGAYVAYDQQAYNSVTGYNTPASLAMLEDVAAEGRKLSKMAIRSSLVPLRPVVLTGMRKKGMMTDNEIKSVMLGNLLDEQIMMVQLCTVLNCSNVEQADVPVPEKLARARAKSGKLPFYDYKVLTLTGEAAEARRSDRGAQDGSSKRSHLRRGHIRRLGDRTTWVRPAIVNPGIETGSVEKSYRVERP